MGIRDYLRIPLLMEQILELPKKHLRNCDVYVNPDVRFFDDSTAFYLDEGLVINNSAEEDSYPPFSAEHNLRRFSSGNYVVEYFIEGKGNHPKIEAKLNKVNSPMENYNYLATIKTVKFRFPQVKVSDEELAYIVAGDFASHLLDLFKNNKMQELLDGLDFIEELHHSPYQKVRELATIGYLEDIQNVWSHSEINPEEVFDYLGSESKKCWLELNRFWNQEERVEKWNGFLLGTRNIRLTPKK